MTKPEGEQPEKSKKLRIIQKPLSEARVERHASPIREAMEDVRNQLMSWNVQEDLYKHEDVEHSATAKYQIASGFNIPTQAFTNRRTKAEVLVGRSESGIATNLDVSLELIERYTDYKLRSTDTESVKEAIAQIQTVHGEQRGKLIARGLCKLVDSVIANVTGKGVAD